MSAAYTEVYGQFYEWILQKIFDYSFQAPPPQVTVTYCHMSPWNLCNSLEAAKSMEVEETDLEIQ